MRWKNLQKNSAVVIAGASGGVGSAIAAQLREHRPDLVLVSASRSVPDRALVDKHIEVRAQEQRSFSELRRELERLEQPVALVFCAWGILHEEGLQPEKRLEDLDLERMQKVFTVNAMAPALLLQACLPALNHGSRAIFAALSARVGSIRDNRLGGWYSYRASKAALNMLLQTAAIECSRRAKALIVTALHPGTVDTGLSEPFQANVPDEKLFSPAYSAAQLLDVIDGLEADRRSAHYLDYAGKYIEW